MSYLNSIEARKTDFFRDLRGAAYEQPTGANGIYDSNLGMWLITPEIENQLALPFVGNLKIHCNGTSNIVYAGEVQTTDNGGLYDGFTPGHFDTIGKGEFWTTGKKHVNQDIAYPVESRVLFGIYEDGGNQIESTDYELKIYIHYERRKE